MGTIYSRIPNINIPSIQNYMALKQNTIKSFDLYMKDCEEYVEKVKNFCKTTYGNTCKEAGKEIQFQVGDGHARYIIATLRPVKLIHLDIGDQWEFPYIHRLTAADIRNRITKES
jgi:hypothetical protein